MTGPPTIEAVVFDMDGTLVDSSRTVPAAYAAAIHELCGRLPTDDEVIAQYSCGPAPALLSHFIERPATDEDVSCWLRHLEARLDATTVYDGVPEVLDALASTGLRLAVFTGATRRAAELQLDRSGLLGLLDEVVGSDEIERVKPAPDGIVRTCSLLGVAPSATAYVGDARNDLRCARAAGTLAVAAGWGHLFEPDDEPHVVAAAPSDLLAIVRGVHS